MPDFVQVPSDGAGKRITSKVFNDGVNDNHTQIVHIGDRTDPNQQQTVNPSGAALTEYSTGAPVFNSFNRMLVAQDELLSAFKFYEGPKAVANKIAEETAGTGSVAFDAANLSYRCRVPAGAGNSANLSSHRRFSYKPGASVTCYFVVGGNTLAQPNTVRRAGLFDESDGLFLELENGVVSFVMRNSLGGIVDTKVAQSAWNGDRMDGTGSDENRSGETLDLTKMNIFAITYQYLSAGVAQLYHYVKGRPVLLHQMDNYGVLSAPYMATTYLPLRSEAATTGAGQTGDTDWYTWCGALVSDGYEDLIRTPLAFEETKTLSDSLETPLISFRPAQVYLGADNRYRYLLQYVSSFTSAEPVLLTLYAGADLVGATWAGSELGLEIDTAATALNSGDAYGKSICAAANTQLINLTEIGGSSSTDGLFRKNDIAQTDVWTITARRLSGAGATDVTAAGAFFEVQ